MKRFGFLDRAVDYLKEAGMEVAAVSKVLSLTRLLRPLCGVLKAMEEFQPDWIVAMGGGSPIDAAKAMWIKYEYPDITFEDMCKVFGIPKLRTESSLLRNFFYIRYSNGSDRICSYHRL